VVLDDPLDPARFFLLVDTGALGRGSWFLGPPFHFPDYRLPECYNEVPAVRARKPLTLRQSLTAFRLKLWDESQGKMVAFP
jgi:hypothetical protein